MIPDFQWFDGIILQEFVCFAFVIVLSILTCFWSTITSGIPHCCLFSMQLMLRQYQQNDNLQNNSREILELFCKYLLHYSLTLWYYYWYVTKTEKLWHHSNNKYWNYPSCFHPLYSSNFTKIILRGEGTIFIIQAPPPE